MTPPAPDTLSPEEMARVLARLPEIKAWASAVEAAARTEETMAALAQAATRIGDVVGLVSNIANSADRQATGLQQVNTAVAEMDGMTQQNAAMVEQATAAARSLAVEADGLAREIARFRIGQTSADRFVAPRPAAQPVHQLQQRVAAAGRRIAQASRPAPQSAGNAALAASDDDWTEF